MMKNKRILITGSCGTIGSELVKTLLVENRYNPKEVIGIDNNESLLFYMSQQYLDNPKASFHLADIRDRDVLARLMKNVDIVFHTAALKHVILCEQSPYEAVQTNIIGCQNIIYAAEENSVEKVIFTSSDKAVNPTNVMGTSKLMGERLMTAANVKYKNSKTIFASTRFGNVLGSNGSVVPIFTQQIKSGGPVTLTDPEMSRFVMSVEEASQLVINSVEYAQGGEVFITKMPVLNISDLAKAMITQLSVYDSTGKGTEISIIGSKPGEKLYEELMSEEETHRAIELEKYFVILPAFRNYYSNFDYDYDHVVSRNVNNPYISSEIEKMSIETISKFMLDNKLLKIEN